MNSNEVPSRENLEGPAPQAVPQAAPAPDAETGAGSEDFSYLPAAAQAEVRAELDAVYSGTLAALREAGAHGKGQGKPGPAAGAKAQRAEFASITRAEDVFAEDDFVELSEDDIPAALASTSPALKAINTAQPPGGIPKE